MKVCVIASLAYSLVNFRYALLREMAEAGHEVVACAPEDDRDVVAALGKIGVRYLRVPMERASLTPFGDVRTLLRLMAIIRKERPAVVLAYTQKPIIYAGLATQLAGRARFHAMVSGLGFVFSDSNASKVLRRFVAVLYRVAIRHAKAVFVFNRDDQGEMARHGILRRGQTVIQVPGSGIDTERFAARPLPAGPPVFLLIARLLRDKGLFEFAEAARKVRAEAPGATLKILGPLDPNPSGVARETLDAWKAEGVIDYLGETRDVTPFLAASTVFVLPTYYREGLPRTILEAMATGRAIITTDMPGCRETVTEGENGFLVPPRDADALAEAMLRFVRDPGLAARMGRRAREIAVGRYSVALVNDQLLRAMGLRGAPTASSVPAGSALGDGVRRAIDIVVSAAGLAVLWPVMLVIAGLVWRAMGWPFFFVQERAGLAGKRFRLVKFRTMTNARDASGRLLDDAARTTKLGRFLRRSRLDELPELWNILVGEMSLIGPRPLPASSPLNTGPGAHLRATRRPGLTGWAQVNGNALLDDERKLALDLWYIENASFALDIAIVVRTLGVVLFGERISTGLRGLG